MSKSVTIKIESWKDIVFLSTKLSHYFVFRGQSNSDWPLSTSLERAMEKFCSKATRAVLTGNKEHWMIHEFRRKYQLYSNSLPNWNNKFEWLSIMQHHGAPTRLLDFTESIYLALYFAVIESNIDSSIFCINRMRLRRKVKEKYSLTFPSNNLKDDWNRKFIELANNNIYNYKTKESKSVVLPLDPERVTKRLSSQQGLFLMPTNVKRTFMENLTATFDEKTDYENFELDINKTDFDYDDLYIIKIIIPAELNTKFSKELIKMNVTSETLFPGLDGLAKSLIQTKIRDGI